MVHDQVVSDEETLEQEIETLRQELDAKLADLAEKQRLKSISGCPVQEGEIFVHNDGCWEVMEVEPIEPGPMGERFSLTIERRSTSPSYPAWSLVASDPKEGAVQ